MVLLPLMTLEYLLILEIHLKTPVPPPTTPTTASQARHKQIMEQNNDDTINTDQGSHKFCCSTN